MKMTMIQASSRQQVVVRAATTKKAGKAVSAGGLWLPNVSRPSWLDGSLPGDRGFDPLGLSKPAEYLQVDLDQNDQNKAVNKAGDVIGKFQGTAGDVSSTALAPYSEVFDLTRFRENEVIHGRWAMLATLGACVAEATTGISWADAGKAELVQTSYLGFNLPFDLNTVTWIEVLLVGGAEIYRNTELDPIRRIYPGGAFDPLGLASDDNSPRTFKLREAEIKHGRLAMVSFFGYGVQSLVTGEGALGSLSLWVKNAKGAL